MKTVNGSPDPEAVGGEVDPDLLQALLVVAARLDAAGASWALTGSLAHALQGVPIPVHDVDIQTDEHGAYLARECLNEWAVEPVSFSATDRVRSHLGVFEVEGVQVEVMGALQKRLPTGDWEPPVDVERHRRHVRVGGRSVPVLTLTYEAEAYGRLGRVERARLLKGYADGSWTT